MNEVIIHPLLDIVKSESNGWEASQSNHKPQEYLSELIRERLAEGILVDDEQKTWNRDPNAQKVWTIVLLELLETVVEYELKSEQSEYEGTFKQRYYFGILDRREWKQSREDMAEI